MKEKKTNHQVFAWSLVITAAIALWSLFFNSNFTTVSNTIFTFLTQKFGWLYLASMLFFVVFVIIIAFSKWGNIRLGPDDSRPEYKTVSWFAMLFGAGMGIGLVFWGISEPISHYVEPIAGIQSATPESAEFAIKASFMNWGIHPWANYAILGMALAYFQFRKKRPGLISSVLDPILGENKRTGIKNLVDVLAVFATVAGVQTSLCLGIFQINSGLNYLFQVPKTLVVQICIIVVISAIYIWIAVAGIDKGAKAISNINLCVAVFLMIALVIVGPKVEIINSFVNGLGDYFGSFIEDSLNISAYGDNSWVENWRIFYWGWWIAWAPFVGLFIARISRGRTIREFIAGVVLAPTLGSLVWFAIFGTLGIKLGQTNVLSSETLQQITTSPETGLFVVIQKYPLGIILCVVAFVFLCTSFVISANSSTFVLSTLTSQGNLNPSNRKKILWGILQSVLLVGMLITGGIKPLQAISVAAAFPFIFIMLFTCVSLVKALRQEK